MANPLTIYNSFAGDPDQDAKTLEEYAKVGFGDTTTMPTAVSYTHLTLPTIYSV